MTNQFLDIYAATGGEGGYVCIYFMCFVLPGWLQVKYPLQDNIE